MHADAACVEVRREVDEVRNVRGCRGTETVLCAGCGCARPREMQFWRMCEECGVAVAQVYVELLSNSEAYASARRISPPRAQD